MPGGVFAGVGGSFLPGNFSKSDGGAGYSRGDGRSGFRGGPGDSQRRQLPGHHALRFFLQFINGFPGVPRQPENKRDESHRVNPLGNHGRVAVRSGDVLHQTGGGPDGPASGDYLLADGEPFGSDEGDGRHGVYTDGCRAAAAVPGTVANQRADPGRRGSPDDGDKFEGTAAARYHLRHPGDIGRRFGKRDDWLGGAGDSPSFEETGGKQLPVPDAGFDAVRGHFPAHRRQYIPNAPGD